MKTQLKQPSVDLRSLLLLLTIVLGSAPAFADTDMTSLLTNPNFDNGETGWEGSNFTVGGRSDNPCAETFNSKTFDAYQILTGLPNGRYLVICQGFYRAGGYEAAASSRNNGTEEHYGYLYANNEQVALRSILDVGKVGLDYSYAGGSSPQLNVVYDGGTYKLPNNMNAASYAFSNGVSLNKLEVEVTNGTLRLGIKKTGHIPVDWIIFDDFHLYKIDGTAEETVKVGSISLSSFYLSMEVGNTITLSTSVYPYNATDKSVTWTSSDPSVATVNASGVVTGIAVGTATIKATANDGSGKYGSCSVLVSLPFSSATIVDGEFPDDTPWYLISRGDEYLYYSPDTDNDFVLNQKIDSNHPMSDGYLWSFVRNEPNGYVMYNKASGTKKCVCLSAEEIYYQGWYKMEMSDYPSYIFISNQGNGEYYLQSQFGNYFTTSWGYFIQTNKPGTSSYTFTKPTVITSCDITGANGVSIENTNIVLNTGESKSTKFVWQPSDAEIKDISFTSSNPSIASVTKDGVITGLLAGKARITCQLTDYNKTWTLYYDVTVVKDNYATLPSNLEDIMIELSGDFYNAPIEEIEFKTGSFITPGKLISYEGSSIYAEYNSSKKKITLYTDAQAYMMKNYTRFRLRSLKSIVGLNLVNTIKMTNMTAMFDGCSSLTSLDLSNFNTENVTDMGRMFSGCSSLTSLDVSNFNTQNVTNMNSMFSGCSSLTSLDVSNFNTQNVTEMNNLFSSCSSLTSLDVSNFNTQNVTDMSAMFANCSSLTSLDVSNFNTQNVIGMGGMFYNCSSLTSINVSNFNTQSVTDMRSMFKDCSSLTSLDLSNFNTQNVTHMFYMFDGCSSLTSLDVSNFNTQNVTDMGGMFANCSSLISLDVSNFNTQNVTGMGYMFSGCSSLTSLNLSNFNTQNVTSADYMFRGCSSLKYLNMCPNLSTIGQLHSNAIVTCPEDTYETYVNDSFCGQYQVVKLNPTDGGTFGDVNNDTDKDVQDLYYVAKGIMAQKDANIYFLPADINQDKELTAADYVGVTNIILGRNYAAAAKGANQLENTQYSDDILSATIGDGAMSIALDNMRDYTAMQMDVTLPEGAAIQKAVRSDRLTASHNVAVAQLADNKWRVLLTSAQNATMKGFNGELFSLTLNGEKSAEAATIDNIQLVEPNMATLLLDSIEATNEATGVTDVYAESNAEGVVYGLDGIRHNSLIGVKSGVYVRDNKKVMVK